MNKVLFDDAAFADFPEVVAGVTIRPRPTVPAYLDENYGLLTNFLEPAEAARIRPEVLARRQQLGELLGPDGQVSFAAQTHSAIVAGAPAEGSATGFTEADAIVSAQPGNLLCVVVADCAGVLLYDPIAKVIAAAHSGWRGTRSNIVGKTVAHMAKLGADPTRIIASISPIACPNHYEVGNEFYDFFDPQFLPQINGKPAFDNRAALRAQLHDAGVTYLAIDPRCVVEDEHFHSARRDGAQAGRFVTFIGRRSNI